MYHYTFIQKFKIMPYRTTCFKIYVTFFGQ